MKNYRRESDEQLINPKGGDLGAPADPDGTLDSHGGDEGSLDKTSELDSHGGDEGSVDGQVQTDVESQMELEAALQEAGIEADSSSFPPEIVQALVDYLNSIEGLNLSQDQVKAGSNAIIQAMGGPPQKSFDEDVTQGNADSQLDVASPGADLGDPEDPDGTLDSHGGDTGSIKDAARSVQGALDDFSEVFKDAKAKHGLPRYWDGNGKYQDKYGDLFERLVPSRGTADTLEGELLRRFSRVYSERYKNGFRGLGASDVKFLTDNRTVLGKYLPDRYINKFFGELGRYVGERTIDVDMEFDAQLENIANAIVIFAAENYDDADMSIIKPEGDDPSGMDDSMIDLDIEIEPDTDGVKSESLATPPSYDRDIIESLQAIHHTPPVNTAELKAIVETPNHEKGGPKPTRQTPSRRINVQRQRLGEDRTAADTDEDFEKWLVNEAAKDRLRERQEARADAEERKPPSLRERQMAILAQARREAQTHKVEAGLPTKAKTDDTTASVKDDSKFNGRDAADDSLKIDHDDLPSLEDVSGIVKKEAVFDIVEVDGAINDSSYAWHLVKRLKKAGINSTRIKGEHAMFAVTPGKVEEAVKVLRQFGYDAKANAYGGTKNRIDESYVSAYFNDAGLDVNRDGQTIRVCVHNPEALRRAVELHTKLAAADPGISAAKFTEENKIDYMEFDVAEMPTSNLDASVYSYNIDPASGVVSRDFTTKMPGTTTAGKVVPDAKTYRTTNRLQPDTGINSS